MCLILIPVFAEDDEVRSEGLTVSLEMGVDALNMVFRNFEHSQFRPSSAQNHSEIQYFVSNWNFDRDTRASIGFDARNYGGSFAFEPQIIGGAWSFGAKIQGWVQFSFLRLTLGNDIETNFADWQGSEEALLFFNWRGWHNPDNITNSIGLMAEAFVNSFTFAVAAGDFITRWIPTTRIQNGENWDNIYLDRYSTDFSYGARIGYSLGELGRINFSYRLTHRTVADSFLPEGGNFPELQPRMADARVNDHLYGLYGSFFFGNIGITAAYLGSLTTYLPEFSMIVGGERRMVETAIPFLFVNGFNVNARWEVNDRFSLRTDNAFSFWRDKNYDVFETRQANWNFNLAIRSNADLFAAVTNFVIRNSVGFDYDFSEAFSGNVYFRNTFHRSSAAGRVPGAETEQREYIFDRSRMELALGVRYAFSPRASVFLKLELGHTTVSRSQDLNSETIGHFVHRVGDIHNVMRNNPLATRDSEFTVRIPIGFTLLIR